MSSTIRKTRVDVEFNSAAALKNLRACTGLTQTAFARLVKMNQADLSKYERGTHSMTMRRLAQIAELAGSRVTVHIEPKRHPKRTP